MHKLLITFCCFSLAILEAAVIDSITSDKVTNWGDWYGFENCPPGKYVVGFRLKVEPFQGQDEDDTALNGIELICNDGSRIRSSNSKWGTWGKDRFCGDGLRANGFKLRQEKGGRADNTAANDFMLRCEDGSELYSGYGEEWGIWGKLKECPSKSYICGIDVQIESPQGGTDDTAVNNVDLNCCN